MSFEWKKRNKYLKYTVSRIISWIPALRRIRDDAPSLLPPPPKCTTFLVRVRSPSIYLVVVAVRVKACIRAVDTDSDTVW